MVLDDSLIGMMWPGSHLLLTRHRLRLFAAATAQTDPVFADVDAARAHGFRDLPAPPTFCFGVALERPNPFAHLEELGIDLRTVPHGEQEFDYHRAACAGDELSSSGVIDDVRVKKGGALIFITIKDTITDQDQRPVVTMRNTLVVRHTKENDR